jgi:hypothetical protein
MEVEMQVQVKRDLDEIDSPASTVTHTFVRHRNYEIAFDEISDFIEDPDEGQPSMCVLGHGRSGKSTICEKLKEKFLDEKDAITVKHPSLGLITADRISVVLVEIPQEPSAAHMGHLILKALGDPNWYRGDRRSVENRIELYTNSCQPMVFLFDEAHNIVDRSGTWAMEGIVDWLKWFHNATKKPQVLLGLHRTEFLFRHNEQLRWRYRAPVFLDSYSLEPDEDGVSHFFGLLAGFQSQLPIPCEFDFCDEAIAPRFLYASSGLVGLLKKVVWRGVKISTSRTGKGVLTMRALARAFQREIMRLYDGKVINPFSACYANEPPPPLISDSQSGVQRRTRRQMKSQARELLSKR